MNIVLNTTQSYDLSQLAKSLTNSDDDLIYIVKQIDGKDVSIAVERSVFLQGISGGDTDKFIVSGGVVWDGAGMNFTSTLINWNYYGDQQISPVQALVLDDGDSLPRTDVFAINVDTNSVDIIKGVPSANPIVPAVGTNQIYIQSVDVAAFATAPTITIDPIYRDNADWTMTTYNTSGTTTGSVDFENTDFPYQGTFDIKSTTSKTTGIRAQRGSKIDLTTYTSMTFAIRFETALPSNRKLIAIAGADGSNIDSANLMPYGIDRNLVGEWQIITLPTSIFQGAGEIDRFQFRMNGGGALDGVEYYLDNILLSTGSAATVPLDTISILHDGNNIGSRPKINFIEGTNVTFDIADDPTNDRVNITINSSGGGGGGGTVDTVVGTTQEIDVDSSDAANPIVSLASEVTDTLDQVGINTSDISDLDDRVDDVELDIVDIEVDIADLQAEKLDITDFLEENLIGTAIYDATLSGAVELDLATFTDIYGILTGNTALTVTNTPASGETFARSMILKSNTAETLTLPVGWKQIGEFVNDGTEYDFEMKFTNYPTAGLKVVVYINPLA